MLSVGYYDFDYKAEKCLTRQKFIWQRATFKSFPLVDKAKFFGSARPTIYKGKSLNSGKGEATRSC